MEKYTYKNGMFKENEKSGRLGELLEMDFLRNKVAGITDVIDTAKVVAEEIPGDIVVTRNDKQYGYEVKAVACLDKIKLNLTEHYWHYATQQFPAVFEGTANEHHSRSGWLPLLDTDFITFWTGVSKKTKQGDKIVRYCFRTADLVEYIMTAIEEIAGVNFDELKEFTLSREKEIRDRVDTTAIIDRYGKLLKSCTRKPYCNGKVWINEQPEVKFIDGKAVEDTDILEKDGYNRHIAYQISIDISYLLDELKKNGKKVAVYSTVFEM